MFNVAQGLYRLMISKARRNSLTKLSNTWSLFEHFKLMNFPAFCVISQVSDHK